MISQYNFLRGRDDHRSSQTLKQISFSEYLEYSRENGEDNFQTRFLSSLLKPALELKAEPVTQQHLEEAKAQLQSFDRVLSLNNFTEAIIQLKEDLRWQRFPAFTPQNTSSGNQNQEPGIRNHPSPGTGRIWDIQLYNWALENFNPTFQKKGLLDLTAGINCIASSPFTVWRIGSG